MTCLGKGAPGFTSLSGSEISAFLTSLRRYPVKKKNIPIQKHKKTFTNTESEAKSDSVSFSSLNLIIKGFS